MITGITVQISSSRVWPCTCAPSAVRGRPRPRYFQMKTTSSVSTRMKIAPVKPRMTKYAVRVFCAFGEFGATGAKPPLPATAAPAATSAATHTKTTTRRSFRRNPRAFYGGERNRARGATGLRARLVRGLRERRPAGSWRRLRGGRPVARVPAHDRPGGPARVLALGVDVARHRRHATASTRASTSSTRRAGSGRWPPASGRSRSTTSRRSRLAAGRRRRRRQAGPR